MRHLSHWDLVRAESVLDRLAVDDFRARPTFRRSQDNHGPARARLETSGAGFALDALDLRDSGVEREGHELVHPGGIVTLDEIRRVTVTVEKCFEFIARDAGE